MTIEEEAASPSRLSLVLALLRLLFRSFLLAVTLIMIGFLVFAGGVDRSQKDPPFIADGITVLTGGPQRIDEAMKLLAANKAQRLLITGVYRRTSSTELKDQATEGDQLFACCVDIDREARNTIDNATETAEWVAKHKYRSVIVVTSNYHMPRALSELGRAMPGVSLYAYPVVEKNVHVDRWWDYPGTTRLLLSEYIKYVPSLGRLGATTLVRRMTSPNNSVAAEEGTEP